MEEKVVYPGNLFTLGIGVEKMPECCLSLHFTDDVQQPHKARKLPSSLSHTHTFIVTISYYTLCDIHINIPSSNLYIITRKKPSTVFLWCLLCRMNANETEEPKAQQTHKRPQAGGESSQLQEPKALWACASSACL